MESRSAWVQQKRSGISFDELSSMVSELVTRFESGPTIPAAPSSTEDASDWISPSGRTSVVRHGSSASLHHVLNQVPGTIAAEYYVLYLGTRVFSWREYMWPRLNPSDAQCHADGMVYLPEDCLDELMEFHISFDTPWLRRFRLQSRHQQEHQSTHHSRQLARTTLNVAGASQSDSTGRTQVDKICVVTQADRLEIQ